MMTEQDFLGEISGIVHVDIGSISTDSHLASFRDWDSLGVVMFIAMADQSCGICVDPKMLSDCKTVGDLARLCKIHGDH